MDLALASEFDAGDIMRARCLGACRGVMDVPFGLETGRPEYVTAGLRALYFCADQV